MRNVWYGDNRDLLKWAVLTILAERYDANRIIQIAYFRSHKFPKVQLDGVDLEIPNAVITHLRDVRNISLIPSVQVTVFDDPFQDRAAYHASVLSFLAKFRDESCVIFLDPDTGLEPAKPRLKHVLVREARAIWEVLKSGEVFAFYQHRTNRAGQPWIESKRLQLERGLGLKKNSIKVANSLQLANDVVIFYALKT